MTTATKTSWRSRIIGHGEEAPDQLLANPRNWRIHPKAQQDALAGVLSEVGWVQDIIVNQQTGHVVDGHLRVSLAISQGEEKVPVLYVDLSEAEEALVLATLDPLAGMAVAAKDALADLLADVTPQSDAVRAMLEDVAKGAGLNGAKEGLTDPDDVPEDVEPTAKRGDVWLCGDHRVMCGDSTKAEDVEKLMAGEKASLMVTDPPYGIGIVHVDGTSDGGSKPFGSTLPGSRPRGDWGRVQRGPKSKNQIIKANEYPVIQGDQEPFDPTHLVGSADVIVIFGANYFAERLPPSPGWICWDKREQITRNSFADCELAWTSTPRPARVFSHLWNGLHKGSQHGERRRHPTEKPVALFEWIIDQYGQEGGLVTDWYLGSGTTMIAAERLGRRCYGMEIEPRYVDVAVKRWEQFTGQKAVLDG